ncbi:MAG: ectonucleotide pyrophosphatase/phosphodiesterase [Sphingomonas sp.]|uniref:alkaline phosphatase family protein n=1 Tax=Sphingomonas sp. TaxID=28214 RepID=UPI002630CE4C|nr:ectonucleotide pyrophosphatase/phosphodiesterase [Sphingomonas sp.]MDK2767228.1 ectonucleotide pyrophosphatase/phosphodiesterase [Sphingomonas sp.]
MHWLRTLAAASIAGLLYACTTPPVMAPAPPAPPVEQRAPVTILIGIDGFRPDYLDRGVTPVLSQLAAQGVRATMRPSFPTKTFPNFYTLVTGKRPDRHGIVGNRFEDPARPGERFTLASDQPYWWDQAEPLWTAAEKAGVQTAVMFWPGSGVEIGGTRPHDWQAFGMAVSGRQRVDAIIDWLRRPAATRPKLLGLYFDTVDTAGHHHGPHDPGTNAAVAEVDALIGRLTSELAALGQPANLVFVADHGMAAVDESRRIQLDTIAAASDFRTVEEGPYAAIEPQPGREAALAAALLKPHPNMECWRRADVPARLHYGRNPRTPSFLCLARIGWTITTRPAREPLRPGGAHGYDPAAPEMAALFLAHGPAFASGVTLPPFDNIHVAPLLRRLAGVPQAQAVDGDAAMLAPALKR